MTQKSGLSLLQWLAFGCHALRLDWPHLCYFSESFKDLDVFLGIGIGKLNLCDVISLWIVFCLDCHNCFSDVHFILCFCTVLAVQSCYGKVGSHRNQINRFNQ